jgi:hypothetical protein
VGELDVDEMIILKLVFKKYCVRRGCRLDSTGPGQDQLAVLCKHSNESLGALKGRRFLDYLRDYQLLKKDHVLTYLLTYLLTHSLTPWCRILFEKLRLSKNILLSCGTRRFITVFTKARHWTLF